MLNNHAVPQRASPPSSSAVKAPLSALLLSQDGELVNTVGDLGRSMSVAIDTCSELLQATRKIATTKYQGILVDYSNELSAAAFINGVRGSTSNAADVVYAFVKDTIQAVAARQVGANFVIPYPISVESVTPYIRAGYGLMVHELLRYFRAPIVFPVNLLAGNGREFIAQSIDLSSGGMAVQASESLMVGQRFDASLHIPGCRQAVEVRLIVCWSDKTRRAGLRFEMPSELAQSVIQRWLRTRIDVQ